MDSPQERYTFLLTTLRQSEIGTTLILGGAVYTKKRNPAPGPTLWFDRGGMYYLTSELASKIHAWENRAHWRLY